MSKEGRTIIGEGFCFSNQMSSIIDTQHALEHFAQHNQDPSEWLKLTSSMPLFFDTNVLLDMYRISMKERDLLINFIEKNKLRIHLPAQVEIEFLRHRTSQIESFQKKVDSIISEFSGIKGELTSWHNKIEERLTNFAERKMVSGDMSSLCSEIENVKSLFRTSIPTPETQKKLLKAADGFEKKLRDAITETYVGQKLEYEDPILKTISNTDILEQFSAEEISFLKNLYDNLKSQYNEEKGGEKKNLYAFPGCGDLSKEKKGFDPYGDFYIYHEIVAYMKQEQTDAVLLTSDTTKDDWIKADGSPFLQYIVNAYQLSGHSLYIVNANRYLIQSNSNTQIGNDDDIEKIEIAPSSKSSAKASNILPGDEQKVVISSYFKDISEEEMVLELKYRLQLSKDYFDGYVGENYFIYKVLGNQNFKFHSSKKVLENLIAANKIVRIEVKKGAHAFNALNIPEDIASD